MFNTAPTTLDGSLPIDPHALLDIFLISLAVVILLGLVLYMMENPPK